MSKKTRKKSQKSPTGKTTRSVPNQTEAVALEVAQATCEQDKQERKNWASRKF
jgi:hypothetical protein